VARIRRPGFSDFEKAEIWQGWKSGKTRTNVMSGFSVLLTFVAENVHGFDVPKVPWPGKDEHVPTIISLDLRDKVPSQIDEADPGSFLALS